MRKSFPRGIPLERGTEAETLRRIEVMIEFRHIKQIAKWRRE